MKRKSLCLIFVVIFLVAMSLSACSNNANEENNSQNNENAVNNTQNDGGNQQNNENDQSNNQNNEEENNEQNEESKPEPVTLTMIAPDFEKNFAAGFQDDPVMKEIEKRVGVRVDITPGNAIADTNAKLSTLMASRDLPDLVYILDDNIRKTMISSKLALNLDPYVDMLYNVEENRPGSFDTFRRQWSLDVDNNKVDGLYFIGLSGTQGNLYRPKVGFYVRWDLYKELGHPEIDNYDDLITLAKDMLELEPTNKDGKTNYGVSAWFAQAGGFGPWALMAPFNWDNGVFTFPSNNYEIDHETDTMKEAITDSDSEFWKNIEWWNKAYREGIVDPDAFTQKWPDYLDRIDKGNRAMISFADFSILNGEALFVQNGEPEKGYIALPSPRDDRNIRPLSSYFASGNRPFMIAEDTEHKEKAVELLNFLASWESTMLIYNGVQGEHWDIVDGKPQLNDEVIKGLNEDENYTLKTGINKYNNMAGMGEVDFWPEYDVPAKLTYMPKVLKEKVTVVEQDAVDYYNVDYPGQIVMKDKDIYQARSGENFIAFNRLPSATGEISEINKEITAKLQEMHFKDIYQAVLAETESEFENVKAELIEKAIKVGGKELYEFHKERFDEASK